MTDWEQDFERRLDNAKQAVIEELDDWLYEQALERLADEYADYIVRWMNGTL